MKLRTSDQTKHGQTVTAGGSEYRVGPDGVVDVADEDAARTLLGQGYDPYSNPVRDAQDASQEQERAAARREHAEREPHTTHHTRSPKGR